jgi:alkylhydroperoxidase family enzyme
MPKYPIHTIASAPEGSKSGLEQLRKAFGVIPNIAAAIANSPKLINSLVGVFAQVHSSSLTEQEIQIVLLTDAVANSSTYAVAFHTGLALQAKVSSDETDEIRERRVPTDKRFAALSILAKTLIEKRGHLSTKDSPRRQVMSSEASSASWSNLSLSPMQSLCERHRRIARFKC